MTETHKIVGTDHLHRPDAAHHRPALCRRLHQDLLYSNCDCHWRIDRLSCAICGNREQGHLNYFHAEGEEACRIDLCDRCHHYIKTIDERILETCDPELEGLATPHLDLLAAEKGFTRATPNPWTGGR